MRKGIERYLRLMGLIFDSMKLGKREVLGEDCL
jgi:hypothetical protein